MKDLDALWYLTGEHRPTYHKDWNQFFDPVGLILLSKLERREDGGSPSNSLTFAVTGGDGVHFGFLGLDHEPDDQCPVVMTLPDADGANIVLGENLREFLKLGCRGGYFTLEQLAYDPEEQIQFLDSQAYDPDADDLEIGLLRKIEFHFGLLPPAGVAARLRELKQKYEDLLK